MRTWNAMLLAGTLAMPTLAQAQLGVAAPGTALGAGARGEANGGWRGRDPGPGRPGGALGERPHDGDWSRRDGRGPEGWQDRGPGRSPNPPDHAEAGPGREHPGRADAGPGRGAFGDPWHSPGNRFGRTPTDGPGRGRPGLDGPRRDGRSDGDWRGSDERHRDDRYGGGWNGSYGWLPPRVDRGGWTRGWRDDRRYDWGRYRDSNRAAFRLPRYYTPYGWRGGYRRFGLGVRLFTGLFAENYWIDDPWSYRLPDAYGPYRWVRYYDDALLVDVRSGVVVDAIYGIFW